MALQQLGHDRLSKERTDDVLTKENVSFKDLLLSPVVLSGLQKARFNRPSPIQLKAIPYGRCGLDLIVQAKSGTGKTCVFTVIALEAISVEASTLQVIILAPTREIAIQIEDVVKAVGQDIKGLKVAAFIGGRPVSEDKFNAKGCHIAVGSPGRIFQLIELEILKCQNVRIFVLDEADKLLEDNFQSQINSIYSMLPVNKQMIAASATYPEELAEFVTRYMRDPTFVRLNPKDMALLGIKQYYYVIKDPPDKSYSVFECKIKAVIELLELHTFQQTLIFSNYHSHAKDLSDACNSAGLPATYISGNMEQQRRLEAMKMLKDFKCRVLISTDLTSRGIDASHVDLVVNLDVPHDWETYMHRTGRAGRFGSLGAIVSVVNSGKEMDELFRIVDSCAISLYQITVENGKLHFATEAAEISSDRKNVEQELNMRNIQVDKQDGSMQPLRGSESLKTGANLDTVRESSSEKLIELNQSKTLSTQHKPPRASHVKIPTLPELMSRKPRLKYSFSYKDLMENLLFYKEHGVFQKLKIIKQLTGVKKIEQNSDNCNENPSVTMHSAPEVKLRPNERQDSQNSIDSPKLLLKTWKDAQKLNAKSQELRHPSKEQSGYNATKVRKTTGFDEETKPCDVAKNLRHEQKDGCRGQMEIDYCEKLLHNLHDDELGDRRSNRKAKIKKEKSKSGESSTRSTPRLLLPRYTGVGDNFSADDISYFVNLTRHYQSAWYDYYYYYQYWTWRRSMYSTHG